MSLTVIIIPFWAARRLAVFITPPLPATFYKPLSRETQATRHSDDIIGNDI
jgi:hypothetical protein